MQRFHQDIKMMEVAESDIITDNRCSLQHHHHPFNPHKSKSSIVFYALIKETSINIGNNDST